MFTITNGIILKGENLIPSKENIVVDDGKIIEIETRREMHLFDFQNFIEFFSWFYCCWEERLKNFNNEWGAFVVSSSNYYRARQKLRKKYMLKY